MSMWMQKSTSWMLKAVNVALSLCVSCMCMTKMLRCYGYSCALVMSRLKTFFSIRSQWSWKLLEKCVEISKFDFIKNKTKFRKQSVNNQDFHVYIAICFQNSMDKSEKCAQLPIKAFRIQSFRRVVQCAVVEDEPQFIEFAQPSVVFHIAMDQLSWIFSSQLFRFYIFVRTARKTTSILLCF